MKLYNTSEIAKALKIPRLRLMRGAEEGRYPFLVVGARKMYDLDVMTEIIRSEDGTPSTNCEGITLEQVRAQTGLSYRTIRDGMDAGWIPFWKQGREYRFDPEQVEAAIKEQMKRNIGR